MRPRLDIAGRARRFAMLIARAAQISLTAVLVLRDLYRLEGKYAVVTPSRAGIAQRIGRSERSVSRAVVALEAAGVISVVRDRPRCRNGTWGRNRTNLYRLKWPPRDRIVPGGTEGTRVSRLCDSEAIEPGRRRPQAARRSSGAVAIPLFVLETDPDPPPEPAAPLPWVAEGITAAEWTRRQQGKPERDTELRLFRWKRS